MDSLITVMNKLQDVFSTIGVSHKVDLPQIVVVGSQSSGKSSVLESLVGKSFLPRGTGIVTRAPLILHLIHPSDSEIENSGTVDSKEWATFLHKPHAIYHDFDKVRKEIETRTEEIAGDKKNITDNPIVLNVYSRLMYNLSFVDLPGLTKVPVGDQPEDIEEKIRNLILRYIRNPNSILLAVVTANTDPATSESLHIAKTVDPNGDRTLAVVTKIDIMDRGTDAMELLSGEVIPVKLGIIGVINRSQKDINENKTIADSLVAERAFFRKAYPSVADDHGTVELGKRLQYLLIKKIKETCPELKKQLYDMNSVYRAQVKQYKEFTSNYDRSLLELITRTATGYRASLDGQAHCTDPLELNGGAKIARYFKFTFFKDIEEIDPLHGLSPEFIVNVINNASGTNMGVFMPAEAFDHLVKKQITLMEAPSICCVNTVYEELMANIYRLDDDISGELKKYPKLMDKINEVLQDQLNKHKQKTIDAVSSLIRYQEAYVNTSHPDFIEAVLGSDEYRELFKQAYQINTEQDFNEQIPGKLAVDNELSVPPANGPGGDLLPPSRLKTFKMRKTVEKITTCAFSGFADTDKLILESRAGLLTLFIKCYFKVIKKIVQDTVPKTVMCELVNNIKNNFQKSLTAKVYKSNDLKMAELLLESEEIVDDRIKTKNRFDASEKALQLMREIEQLCHLTD